MLPQVSEDCFTTSQQLEVTMHPSSVASFQVTEFLPEIKDGLTTYDRTSVVFCMHSKDCPGCLDYVNSLNPLASEFDVWDGSFFVIAPGADAPITQFGEGRSDPEHRISDGGAALLVADRYGHIFHVHDAGDGHQLPLPREIAEWLKYLGTLCPE
jgi:hypothetical protein